LGDLLFTDHLFEITGVAQQRQVGQLLGQTLEAIVDEAEHAGANIAVVLQILGNAYAIVGAAKNHGVLQEHAACHQAAEQGEHCQAFGAEQDGAGEEPERQMLGFEIAEHPHALMHEDQEAERCRPGDEHDAEAQQGAEHLFAVDAYGLENDDAQYREEAEEGAERTAGR